MVLFVKVYSYNCLISENSQLFLITEFSTFGNNVIVCVFVLNVIFGALW